MRLIQVLVPDDQLSDVTGVLSDDDVTFVRQRAWSDGEEQWLVEFPVPTDAIGYMKDRLHSIGIQTEEYSTIIGLESATTPKVEQLNNRFADDFDPLTPSELRSKARDNSRDTRSFLAMIFLSAIIAVSGLLIESAAVVVGSMVIAPIVGPVLTTSVGAVTDDREMVLHSIWIQSAGLIVAIAGAFVFSLGLQYTGFFPRTLDISSIDLIALRIAPNLVTIAIGLTAGAAGAFGLMTKGPTSLIGVMIAAALIPTAATAGIAAAWGQYLIAIGSLVLLLLSVILINIGAYVVLQYFYRSGTDEWFFPSRSTRKRLVVIGTVLGVVILVALVGIASYQQIAFERTVNMEIHETLDEPRYEELRVVSVRIQYRGGLLGSPEMVTVVLSRPSDGTGPPSIAGEFDNRITEATGDAVDVRVRFIDYQQSHGGSPTG